MKINKPIVVGAVAATLTLTGVAGLGFASAQTSTDSGTDLSLIERIAQKFNLKEEEVQAVFNEDKAAKNTERQAEQSERLQDAVDDGDITAGQKTKIEAKLKELQATRESEHDELEAWAEDNGINLRYLMGGGRGANDERLQDLVDDGDITAGQKTKIAQKQQELADKRKAARDSLEQWAEDNDIDEQYLMGGPSGGGHGGGPGHGGFERW